MSNQVGIVGESVYLHSLSQNAARNAAYWSAALNCADKMVFIFPFRARCSLLWAAAAAASQPILLDREEGPLIISYKEVPGGGGGTPHTGSELCPHPYTLRQPQRTTSSKDKHVHARAWKRFRLI